ncbi:hypothetical protein RIF29_20139 [Crotalaria pallida]|uniref:Helitron helicase-like domain-containing protein n=1 Tax=Crotalaria pallida TaxID=3830 RepID=A0AAN9F519_CROPI
MPRKNCSELLNSSKSAATDDDYPSDFKSLIGRVLLFKVVNDSVTTSADSCVFKVRSICDDSNIISMYELPGGELSPTKAFPSSYKVPTGEFVPVNSSELEETSAFVSDIMLTPVSLGDDDNVVGMSSSSVKRRLEPEFDDASWTSFQLKDCTFLLAQSQMNPIFMIILSMKLQLWNLIYWELLCINLCLIIVNIQMKLDAMMEDFKKGHVFGEVVAGMYTVEFQKRGLPHAHILLWLDGEGIMV